MSPTIDDPRLVLPQCPSLLPIKTVHKNPWFSVLDRGGHYTIEYTCPQVMILPIVDDKEIIMVRVYRPIINDITLELPAGGVEAHETPLEAAGRELKEEVGIDIFDRQRFEMISPLVHMTRSPCMPYYFQVHLSKREFYNRKDHDSEIASVECFEFKEVLDKILNGEIFIGLHIAIITRYLMKHASSSFCG